MLSSCHVSVAFFVLLSASCTQSPSVSVPFAATSTLDLSPQQDEFLRALRRDPANVSVRVVRFDPTTLARADGTLDLASAVPTSAHVQVVHSDKALYADGSVASITAESRDHASEAILVVRNGLCTGTIRTSRALFVVRPIGGGLHAILQRDFSKTPPDHPPSSHGQLADKPARRRDAAEKAVAPVSDDGSPVAIDVLCLFTTDVKKNSADPEGLATSAIAHANVAFRESSLPLTLACARVQLVEYSESGNQETDLQRLIAVDDGFLDDVHSIRDTVRADIVVMLVNDSAICGISGEIGASADTAFAVVHYTCADSYLSLAHEVGHLLGARHNPEADPTPTYAHGYICNAKQWRTVMAYNLDCDCLRIARWSGPKVLYNGDIAGSDATHNNVRALGETCRRVAAFR